MRYDQLHCLCMTEAERFQALMHACQDASNELYSLRRRLMFIVSYLTSIGALVLLWLVYPKVEPLFQCRAST